MNPIYILNTSAITDGEIKPRHTLVVQGGKITALLPNDNVQELPPQAQIIDANGAYAAPAFMDLHIHGLAGHGPENASEEDLLQMSLALAGLGVGAFCPRFIVQPRSKCCTFCVPPPARLAKKREPNYWDFI